MKRISGGVLLVTGTCIGAGMLGLPIKTAAAGLNASILLFLSVWALMATSALLMLEAALWFKNEANLLSMSQETLTTVGKTMVGLIYILFLYALLSAYTAGGSTLWGEIAKWLQLPQWFATNPNTIMVFSGILVSIVFAGIQWVDYCNRILMVGLIVSYCFIIGHFPPEARQAPQNIQLISLWYALPILVTSFGFHLLIPSLKTYLQANLPALRKTILIGSFIPFIIYGIWEAVILWSVPLEGSQGLLNMLQSQENPAELLVRAFAQNNYLQLGITFFSFFALTTSFMGVAIGLFDFFADALQVQKTFFTKIWLTLLTFLPPLIFTVWVPRGFLVALGYAGVFAAILLIVLPVLMVWSGRYWKGIAHGYRVKGGKPLLVGVFLAGLAVIYAELMQHIN